MAAIPASYFAHNIEVLGYHDLGGRPAFKLAMQEVAGRWYLYMGHLWHRGWTILDVTDPTAPQHVAFIPGPENTWTIQIQVAEGKMITALERIAPGWGGTEGKEFSEGFLIWDVSDPKKPKQLGHHRTHSTGTHRNFYDGGSLVHVAGGAPGFDKKIYQIIDISDANKPKEISRFWLPEQEETAPKTGARLSCHGPPHVEGDRAYLPYGEGGAIIVDISDISHPKMVSQLLFSGLCSRQGIHTYLPLPSRKLALVNAGLRVYDIRDSRTPKEIAYFIPPDPKERIGTKPSRLVAQVEDVLVDRRGCIYISEKNQGLYILRLKNVWPYSSI